MGASEQFNDVMAKDAELVARIDDLSERVKAYPKEVESYDALLLAVREGMSMWQVCELDLRKLEKETEDEVEKAVLVREINQAHEKYHDYDMKRLMYVNLKVQNTSKLHKFGTAMKTTGDQMQSAGNAMQSAGNAMTTGCTIPIIVVILLFFLLLFIL